LFFIFHSQRFNNYKNNIKSLLASSKQNKINELKLDQVDPNENQQSQQQHPQQQLQFKQIGIKFNLFF
jgi:hypothetical protein